MKKILIVCDSLRVGGIQSALINFIRHLDLDKYDVSLFLFNDDNSKDIFDDRVEVISGGKLLKIISYTLKEAKSKGIVVYLIRMLLAILCRLFGSNFVYGIIFGFEKKLEGYDFAISYSNNVSSRSTYFGYNKFVLEKVFAKEKITWLHVDYNVYSLNDRVNNREYEKFDKIVCVSRYVRKTLIDCVPTVADKTVYISNFLDFDIIRNKAELFVPNNYDSSCFNIVSVGRLDNNKNQIMQLEIAKRLKSKGIKYKWYLVGDGENRKKLEDFVVMNKLEDEVFFLGNQSNPYPYIKNADLFVSTSKSESYGLSIAEALMLNVIVVSLYYEAIEELFNGNNIVIGKDIMELEDAVVKVINDRKYYESQKVNSVIDNENLDILKKIDELLGN